MLTPEIHAELFVSQSLPETRFDVGGLTPQLPCVGRFDPREIEP